MYRRGPKTPAFILKEGYMDKFPRTMVGGVSLPRMIIGTNWILGWSHQSVAKDNFIKTFQTREKVAEILSVFLDAGVDAIMSPISPMLRDAIRDAEDRAGRKIVWIVTPSFNLLPGGPPQQEPERVLDACRELGATFCLPHQCATDALIDRRARVIRDLDRYTKMIRDRGMIPGLSTHMPEAVPYADAMNADVATYIQIYNAAGFLMQIEVDWVMRIIAEAKKPVMTIKPFAAGRLSVAVGLAFVWSTIREQDMVTVGTTTPDEAKEVIAISLDLLSRRMPSNVLQKTRSKQSLEPAKARA
jgi:hypothetical protein